jgi:hypothetical protein
MPNFTSAKDAIKSELEHARKGAAYYQSLVDTLEEALAKLDSIGSGADMPVRKSAGIGSARAAGASKRGRPARAKNATGKTLPSTGKDFWPSLVTEEPQSASQILHAAIERLGFTPDEEQLQKLRQRMTFAINSLVKTNKIQDAGSGRERRFFTAK